MEKMRFLYVFLVILLGASCEDAPCYRPQKLLKIETNCKTDPEVTTTTGSFLEQVHEKVQAAIEQTKEILNFAKKKLGIDIGEPAEPAKKCEFYLCVFRRMNVLNSNDYPNMTLVTDWINENMETDGETMIYDQVGNCFKEMTDDNMNDEKTTATACESASKLMQCLDMDSLCTPFQFP